MKEELEKVLLGAIILEEMIGDVKHDYASNLVDQMESDIIKKAMEDMSKSDEAKKARERLISMGMIGGMFRK